MDRCAVTSRISRILFSGPLGYFAARAMEKRNLEAEVEAIETLAPEPDHAVLAIGFGPGVGVMHLLPRVPEGWVGGIDPSRLMVRHARRRNAEAGEAQRVVLKRADTRAIPWPDATFDGAISVNTLQLWYPLAGSSIEVARVLKAGAKLVTFTHDWAIEKTTGGSVEAWVERVRQAFAEAGLTHVEHWRGKAENGGSVALTAIRAAT